MKAQLRIRSEFSFRLAFGRAGSVCSRIAELGGEVAAITDRGGTWGHVQFAKAAKKAGIRPLFGVELAVVERPTEKEKQSPAPFVLIAKSNAGLRRLYETVTLATAQTYYFPRLGYSQLADLGREVLIIVPRQADLTRLPHGLPPASVAFVPSPRTAAYAEAGRFPLVAASDNFYPSPADRPAYEIVAGRNRDNRTTAMHIVGEDEWLAANPYYPSALLNAYRIAAECDAELPKASLPALEWPKSLEQLCKEGAKRRKIDLRKEPYKSRLRRELDLIAEKDFEAYFQIIADLVSYAKGEMLVGPARGSSCGSLVCYLLGITDINPIPWGLLFERFIDINRRDLPDIDIDFQDDRRELVFTYLEEKYGKECVARLGTVLRFKAKSTIATVADALRIPKHEVYELKESIIERSVGDARAAFCIQDTFESVAIGQKLVKQYPELVIATAIEQHAQYSGQHAAGVVVTDKPLAHYCSVDTPKSAMQVDKYDAESLNLLKIDALGLRTLTVINDTLEQIGKSREWLLNQPTDDAKAFALLNEHRFAGVFQFEGLAVQSLSKTMTVESLADICALTALARPGPMHSGGAVEYCRRRTGASEAKCLHPSIAHLTDETHGIVVYQEQVMQIAREMGRMSWEDVSTLRKAMSKSLGKEYFDQFYSQFAEGARAQGITDEESRYVWDQINTMGSWSFNKSHAVAYGLVSYWCLLLKAHYPLEFACSCLRHARDEDGARKVLREVVSSGFTYIPIDRERSQEDWTISDGQLLGGLRNIKGCGPAKAKEILYRRKMGLPLTKGLERMLTAGVTPFAVLYEREKLFGDILAAPEKFNIRTPIRTIEQITDETEGEVCFIAKIAEKNLRDHNEPASIAKRGYELRGQTKFLNLRLADDTSSIRCTIGRRDYPSIGQPIADEGAVGDWYLWKGYTDRGERRCMITRFRRLTTNGLRFDVVKA